MVFSLLPICDMLCVKSMPSKPVYIYVAPQKYFHTSDLINSYLCTHMYISTYIIYVMFSGIKCRMAKKISN